MTKVFFSYSHDDEFHRDQLEKHLSALRHEGLVESWHDRRILAGQNFDQEIDRQLEDAGVVLLLVSASFLASNYCYGIEYKRAVQRQKDGSCKLIPIIVRACEWTKTPIGQLLAAPKDGRAITLWSNYDEAMTDVASQVRKVIEAMQENQPVPKHQAGLVRPSAPVATQALPRSSNMRLRKDFTDADRDHFLHETFEYLAQFFEGSLQELASRNSAIEGRFRRIDANTFTGMVYLAGKKLAECSIRVGGPFGGNSISYSSDANARGNSANDMLQIDNDDSVLFWKPTMSAFSTDKKLKWTQEQAAEHYWSALMRPLQ